MRPGRQGGVDFGGIERGAPRLLSGNVVGPPGGECLDRAGRQRGAGRGRSRRWGGQGGCGSARRQGWRGRWAASAGSPSADENAKRQAAKTTASSRMVSSAPRMERSGPLPSGCLLMIASRVYFCQLMSLDHTMKG